MSAWVLVVDDQEDIRLMASFTLRVRGVEVVTVADGAAARAHVAAGPPPLAVVMDYRLRHELGTDVIRELRTDGYAGLVLLFSAHVDERLSREAAALGVPAISKTEIDTVRSLLEQERDAA